MDKYGAIDVGTNSIRLLIWEEKDGKVNRKKMLNSTRIGQRVDHTGCLSQEGINISVDAIEDFVSRAENEGIKNIPIIATSAVRDAKNRNEFVDAVFSRTGKKVHVIKGEEEARLGYLGVIMGLGQVGNILIIDIGGGSTEFIYGDSKNIKLLESINIGAVRLTEKFIENQLVTKAEEEKLIDYIDESIKDIIDIMKDKPIDWLVGIGGTATTMVSMDKKMIVYNEDEVHNTKLERKNIDMIIDRLKKMTLEERKGIAGLQPKRADIIYAGAVILKRILDRIGKDKILISEYDNLEGLVHEQKRGKII
ncbi:MAG: Ppx/GppA family phosphatase [Anaeromicrobium sp.]|jgi:exopolyphosphatase/guanosine-5'-triphosphate,3'-diphosphate pyrophosphatase|uniref:Ppx/GppA phosphatase family protein n=1 Tax=Anaeromicrobium sp. TaxID=1929132 RepID=UPI0025FE24F0|nr:Ppx/GppA phosphatase family protein [Anaeromicrobium sp.]MCT4594054.1 Ppx/GppA family phosphatase [Anaeromicrobium sp.]